MNRRTFLHSSLAAMAAASARAARKYRAALIGHTGRGNFGHEWDLSFNGFAEIEVAAVADPDNTGRQRAQQRSGALRGYSDYREMIQREKPDLVAICPRWLDQRLDMFTAAAEGGAHILIEKPFARDLAEADTMVDLAERHRIKVQVGHIARQAPVTLRALRMVRAGEIGTLMEMRGRGKEDRRAGGEDMMVLGSHIFDLMRFFAGDPQWVFAYVTHKGERMGQAHAHEGTEFIGPIAGDEIAAVFYFASGMHGFFGSRTSGQSSGDRFGLTLYGTKGALFLPQTSVPLEPPRILRGATWTSGAWETLDYQPGEKIGTRKEVNASMVRDLLQAIEGDREPICGARDGRWTIEMVMGVYQSHMAGARLSFPLRSRRHPLSGSVSHK